MALICTVTGTITAPNGLPIAGAAVTFAPAPVLPRPRGPVVTQPSPVTVIANSSGVITVGLTVGTYSVRVRDGDRDYPGFLIDVPAAASALLKDIVFHLAPPQTIYDAQAAARAAARSAFDSLNTFVVTDISPETVTIRIASHRVIFDGVQQIEINGVQYPIEVVTLEVAQ